MRLTAITALLGLLPSAFALPHEGHTHEEPKAPATNATAKPVHYGMVVFPGFQPLDIYGPLDVIGALSMVANETVHLSVLSRDMKPVSSKMQPKPNMTHKHSDWGHSILPTNTFKDVLEQPICPERGDIEVLLVPGGGGTRGDMSAEIAFVKEMFPRVKHVLTICTGAAILAQTGTLDGHKATTNKKAWKWATSMGPNVQWVPKARWVDAGKIWTSSGVSAGIDMTFAWVANLYGQDVADKIGGFLEYQQWTEGADYDPFAELNGLTGPTNGTQGAHEH